jgi:FkbH-like protein
MKAEIRSFSAAYLQRITQLINKTNQFNLTTKRYTLSEIEAITRDPSYIKLYGRLADSFGDNGLVSVIIGQINGADLYIDLWLMSCRVISRNLEHAMFDELVSECEKIGIGRIFGRYLRTAKNGLVADLYALLGFQLLQSSGREDLWGITVPSEYQNANKLIEVNNG